LIKLLSLCQVHNHPLSTFRMSTYKKQGGAATKTMTTKPAKASSRSLNAVSDFQPDSFYRLLPSAREYLATFSGIAIPAFSRASGTGAAGVTGSGSTPAQIGSS